MMGRNRKNDDDKNTGKKSSTLVTKETAQQSHQRNESIEFEKTESSPNIKTVLVCAVCCFIINAFHVSSMFENYRHFSHLSNLEREMTFRTEMGLYYSYYKTIIEADSFISGINKLIYDNKTEYPEVINVLQRFNLYPEVMLGGTFKAFENLFSYFDLKLPKICWQVSRGSDLEAVVSCEGMGDPVYWYLSGIWLSAGCTAAFLFIHGVQLSKSYLGGFVTIFCFFFNHGEATRVQWTPPLRESFAFPWSIALNIIITHILRSSQISWVHSIIYGKIALIYLLCWQFGQYTIALNVLILYVMYSLKMIGVKTMLLVLFGAIYAFTNNIVFQFGNMFLLSSFLSGVLLGIFLLYVFVEPVIQHFPPPTNIGMQIAFAFIASIASKMELSRLLGVVDDSHIINVIKSKFTNYSDFHTLLYTCSAEFDFLPKESLNKLCETFLIPCAVFAFSLYLVNFLAIIKRNFKKRIEETGTKTPIFSGVDCGIVFSFLLLAAYSIKASMIMRLKLFFTPQLCIVSSLIANPKYWKKISKREIHLTIIALILSVMSFKGLQNIKEQRNVVSEYSNPELEELILWINSETGQDAVFAGPMPLMANILLSTRRPIVNHPHYENADLRERTKKVYSVFSRRSPEMVYDTLLSLKINYIVLEESWCFRKSKPGCGMVDLWDIEEPQYKKRQPLCPKLFRRSPAPFHQVFSNSEYVVLQVPSKYIEIPAPKTHSSSY